MLDYKTIIIKRYALNLSGTQIAKDLGCSKSGVNDFLKRFGECQTIGFPLPNGITNYGITELVYGRVSSQGARNEAFVLPDYTGASADDIKEEHDAHLPVEPVQEEM